MSESKYSSQMKHRKAHYKSLTLDLRPEIFEAFRAACTANGTTMTTEIKRFIAEYLDHSPRA